MSFPITLSQVSATQFKIVKNQVLNSGEIVIVGSNDINFGSSSTMFLGDIGTSIGEYTTPYGSIGDISDFCYFRVFSMFTLDYISNVLDTAPAPAPAPPTEWQQLGLDIDGEAATDYSGHSVSLSANGSRVAIGAYLNDGNGPESGHVRIYDYNGTNWIKIGEIDGFSSGDLSGSVSLSANGEIIAIGAFGNDGTTGDITDNRGHVRIFKYINGTIWQQIGEIIGDESNDHIGNVVSLSAHGTTVAIGALKSNANGYVNIYQYTQSGWTQVGNIAGESRYDINGFSLSLSIDGSIVAIGEPANDSVYIYQYNGSDWNKIGEITESTGDQTGSSVSLNANGTVIAIASQVTGHVRIHQYINESIWQEIGEITGSTGDYTGFSVSLSADGTTVAFGAPYSNENGPMSGQVNIYRYNGSDWSLLGDFNGEDQYNLSGFSVSLSAYGHRVAIGAPHNNGNGSQSGHVRVYELPTLTTIAPTISWSSNITKMVGETITLSTPTSNSYGVFTYSSSNTSVATITNGIISTLSIIGNGSAIITATQTESNPYLEGSISFIVTGNLPATPTPVIVNFNVTVDASSNLTIFGMEPTTEPANTITAEYDLPVNALYSETEPLIEFWEDNANENIVKCQLANIDTSADGGLNLIGAYQKTAKRLARGLQKVLCNALNCSTAIPYNDNKYANNAEYYIQRDFGRVALGTFAHYLFGHVDATAAITNDIDFITSMLSLNGSNAAAAATNETTTGPTERYNAWSKVDEVSNNDVQIWSDAATITDANLAVRLVKAIVGKGLVGGEPVEQVVTDISTIDASNNTLAYIAAQVLGQDASRMINNDNSERSKNAHQGLIFIPGDTIFMNIRLPTPTVNVSPHSGSSVNNLTDKYVQERSYTLKITLDVPDATL
jgi:hypothetical protein